MSEAYQQFLEERYPKRVKELREVAEAFEKEKSSRKLTRFLVTLMQSQGFTRQDIAACVQDAENKISS